MPNKGRPVRRQGAPQQIEKSVSLLATEEEKQATSLSLYSDRKARVSYHLSSLNDSHRLPLFRGALSSVLLGKHVLHLGCGMGLAAMMLARSKAASVVAVDNSAIVESAKIVATQNALTNVFFHSGTVYDLFSVDSATGKVAVANAPLQAFIERLPNAPSPFRFDAVVCEWMGPMLLSEPASLAQTLFARNHLMQAVEEKGDSATAPIIFPQRSSLHVVGVSDYRYRSETMDFWDGVYGFNMSPMKPLVLEDASSSSIPSAALVTDCCDVATMDVWTTSAGERAVPGECSAQCVEGDIVLVARQRSTIHFLTFYVDALFQHPTDGGVNIVMGFHPGGGYRANAWTEVSVMLKTAIPVLPGDRVVGHVRLSTPAHAVLSSKVPPTHIDVRIDRVERAGAAIPMVDDASLTSTSTHLYFA